MRAWLGTGARIGAGLWLAACAKTANLGGDACPRGAKCEVEHIDVPQERIDVHTTGPALEPIWKASELLLDGTTVRRVDRHSTLAAVPNGGLWLFAPEPGQIGVTVLGNDGMVMEQTAIEPPPGLNVASEAIPSFRVAASHPRGPVLSAQWYRDCGEAGCRALNELLVFGASAGQPPRRLSPFAPDDHSETIETIHRSADGNAVFVAGVGSPVSMIDLQGNVLWTTELSLHEFDELPNTSRRQSGVVPFRSGAVSPTGELVFSIDTSTSEGAPSWSWRPFPIGLLRIDERGTKSVRLYEGGANPVGEAPPGHPNAALGFDTQGRLLVVYRLLDGDLLVLRMTDDSAERFRILREDYADLELYDTAMDPAGTLYIATAGGGREWESAMPLLCRVPEQGSPACVSIPARTFDIEAPAPNIVFALMGDELARFDFE